MNYIESTNLNAGSTIENLAVTKGNFPIYFYIDVDRNITEDISATATSFEAESGHGLTLGDYVKIEEEIMYVKGTLGNKTVFVERAKRGTTAVAHSQPKDIYKEWNYLNNEALDTGSIITESLTVLDLQNPAWYDISLEVKTDCDQDYSSETITVYYGFSGYSDLDLSSINTLLSNEESFEVTFGNNAETYTITDVIKPKARYMYFWVTGDASLTDADTKAYFTINQV